MSSLLAKLAKNSTIKEADVLTESSFFKDKPFVTTKVPALNIALAGDINGGFTSGLTQWCGPSKHFKTLFCLLMAKSYMDKYPDAVLLFYDSEFGTPNAYFESVGIDKSRILHTPLTNIEELKIDIMKQLEGINRGDKVFLLIDSVGNLASKKEVEDALEGKTVADMSRAKQLKSLFRMVTPILTLKDLPMHVVNHTYKTLELYAKDVVGGGCVVAGTNIQLADGSMKPVEDFVVGDLVRTLDGDKEVTAVWNPETLDEGEPECFEVEFEDSYKVICSDKHKFLVGGKWIEAKDLVVGMESAEYKET